MKKILVVDDNEAILDMLKELLELNGFSVQLLSAGKVVLDTVIREQPDLVLLDVLLGRENGLSICREIKENPCTCNIPVMMMSALDRSLIATELAPDFFLAKPFDIRSLISEIRELAA
ncbi:response regulator transcription factor [Taibaiella koreensis]|uniref:response regulator transcription factor n=1 Tax=Taibaiella koreensis TaxID=1268548 RepID=UPI000E59F7BE|nr:response regulator [Taibaiella koreensis]